MTHENKHTEVGSRTVFLVALAVVAALTAAPALAGDEPAGQKVFMAQKCNVCHAVSSVGIEATTKSEKLLGPDLATLESSHDATWTARYLRKEEELDGKAHSKEFKGTDEELQELVAWLMEQRQDG